MFPPLASTPPRAARRLAGATTLIAAAALLAPPALPPAGAAHASATAKSTPFSGRIISGTGRYANLRGTVSLVLLASTKAPVATSSGTTYLFTLTLSGPSCASHPVAAPHRCAALSGRLTGSATSGPRRVPDVGTTYALTAGGAVKPLGRVSATGTTQGLGFIARGRIPLRLRLRNAAGGVTITAQGPLVPGFSSPF